MSAALKLFLPEEPCPEEPADPKSMRMPYPHALCPKGEWTLRKCCEEWIFPLLEGDQTATRRLLLDALGHWERWTTNPGIGFVEASHVELLRSGMLKTREKTKAPYSRETIRKTWRYLSRLLRMAHQRGLLDQVPVMKPLAPASGRGREVPACDLNAFYRACSTATWPEHPQISPPDFWRTAVVIFVFLGPRCMDLFNRLPWRGDVVEPKMPAVGVYLQHRCPDSQLDRLTKWKNGWLVYRPEKTKRLKPGPLVLPIHPVVRTHLDRIAGDRPFVLPMSKANHALQEQWERLLVASGVPREFWFTRHDLRRTCENRYPDNMGEHITGHAANTVSDRYYKTYGPRIVDAMRKVKVPKAFKETGTSIDDRQKQLF